MNNSTRSPSCHACMVKVCGQSLQHPTIARFQNLPMPSERLLLHCIVVLKSYTSEDNENAERLFTGELKRSGYSSSSISLTKPKRNACGYPCTISACRNFPTTIRVEVVSANLSLCHWPINSLKSPWFRTPNARSYVHCAQNNLRFGKNQAVCDYPCRCP